MQSFKNALLLALMGTALALAACAPAAQPTPTPTPAITYPSGKGDVVVQWQRFGGFVPYLYRDLWVPHLTVYGDGTVLYVKYDQASNGNILLEGHLGDRALGDLVADAVNNTRFFSSKKSYSNPFVADAPTSQFTVRAMGKELTVSAYGILNEPMHQRPPDWSADDVAQWDRLVAWQAKLEAFDLRGSPDPERQDLGLFEPEAAFLYVERLPAGSGQGAVQWPLAQVDLDTLAPTEGPSHSSPVEADIVRLLRPLLPIEGAKLFLDKGVVYQVGYRPRLPFDWTWNGSPPPHVTSVQPQPFASVAGSLAPNGLCVGFHFQRPTLMGNDPTQAVTLSLDSQDVTSSLRWVVTKDLPTSQGTGCYQPSQPLEPGQHHVTLAYKDQAGAAYSYTWEFTTQ